VAKELIGKIHKIEEKPMKETVERIVQKHQLKFTLLFVLGILFTVGFACESGGDKVPPDAELQTLVKETTTDFAGFIETGDFSKIYNKASSDFRSTYTLDQAKNAFSVFLDKKDLVLPSIKSASGMNANFSKDPVDPPGERQQYPCHRRPVRLQAVPGKIRI
jgi:hypothetical protein